MKKVFILFIFILALESNYLKAQQRLQMSQYMLNSFLQNPAFAGANDFAEATIAYRNQWVGFTDAPQTFYASVQGTNKSLFSRSGNNTFINRRKKSHGGWGLIVGSDKFGAIAYNSFFISYAYHIRLSKKLFASVGISPGVMNYVLNGDKLTLPDKSVDNQTYFQQLSVSKPDINIGTTLYGKIFYVGISSFQLLRNKTYDAMTSDDNSQRIHYNVSAGFHFKDGDYTFMPSLLIKYVTGAPTTTDISFRTGYKNIAWIGVSYRTGDSFIALFGYNISNSLYAGYSYDYTVSALKNFNSGSHEIMLGYKFGVPKRSVPRLPD